MFSSEPSNLSTSYTVCIAFLQNPTIPEGCPKGYVLWDMTFFLRNRDSEGASANVDSEGSHSEPLWKTALVRQFVRNPVESDASMYALCVVTFSKVDPKIVKDYIPTITDDEIEDYIYMGEIHYAAPLDSINAIPRVPPFLLSVGPCANTNRTTAEWDMPIKNFTMGRTGQPFDVHVKIPDSSRWKKKPCGWDLAEVAVASTLTDIIQTSRAGYTGPSAQAELEAITFIGKAPAVAPSMKTPPSAVSPSPPSRRLRQVPNVGANLKRPATEAFGSDNGSIDEEPLSQRLRSRSDGREANNRGSNTASSRTVNLRDGDN